MPLQVRVEFDVETQTLDALQAAAYRLIGTATCQIAKLDGRWVCELTGPTGVPKGPPLDADALRTRYLDFVTDENLRMRIDEKTAGVRNVILALAFGSLAKSQDDRN